MNRISASSSSVELKGLSKFYANSTAPAVADVNLHIAPGEFVTLLGPSGSGKSTTLGMVAGFTKVSAGSILLDGSDVSLVPANKRNLGMVFQSYSLFPHMTVGENVEFPLRQRKIPRAERIRLVKEMLTRVQLGSFGDRSPQQLSGGQQQRVALARALVFNPGVLLLDEPFGALDKRLREAMQMELSTLHRELGTTCIFVTHDQDEALAMSDRIAVFSEGRIEQVGSPRELYENPASLFVAEFLGDSTIFHGRVGADGRSIETPRLGVFAAPNVSGDMAPGDSAALVVRPEKLRLSQLGQTAHGNQVPGEVVQVVYRGAVESVLVAVAPNTVVTAHQAGGHFPAQVGDQVSVVWDGSEGVLVRAGGEPGVAATHLAAVVD
jgi:putative spermidine/putrescine transport system ATP-binding protein